MDAVQDIIIAIVCAFAASTGFWSVLQKRSEKKSVHTQMLIGLGHDRITFLCKCYIERGWITSEEYENLHDYLYQPYLKMGGNGSAKRLMEEVEKLEIRPAFINTKKRGEQSHETHQQDVRCP